MVKKWKRSRESEQEHERQRCLKFAETIIDTWGSRRFRYPSSQDRESVDRSVFSVLLQELDAPQLVCRFLAQIMSRDAEVQLNRSFPAFCRQHGWKVFESHLIAVIDASSAATILRNAEALQILCLERRHEADRMELCLRMAEHIVAALMKLDRRRSEDRTGNDVLDDDSTEDESFDGGWPDNGWQTRKIDRSSLLTALVKSLIAVERLAHPSAP